jgi:hypothetical protein
MRKFVFPGQVSTMLVQFMNGMEPFVARVVVSR